MKASYGPQVSEYIAEARDIIQIGSCTRTLYGTPTEGRTLTITSPTGRLELFVPEAAWPAFRILIERNGGTVIVPANVG